MHWVHIGAVWGSDEVMSAKALFKPWYIICGIVQNKDKRTLVFTINPNFFYTLLYKQSADSPIWNSLLILILFSGGSAWGKETVSDGFHEWKRLGKEMSSRMHAITSISEKSNMISQGFFNHFYSPCKHTLLLAKQMPAHMPSRSTRHRLGQVGISVHQFLLWIQRMSVSPPYESLCVSKVVIDVKFLKGCLARCEHLIHAILCVLYII